MRNRFYRELTPLERLRLLTPLGVRFWDAAREAPVGPGLLLAAWPETAPGQRCQGVLGQAGVYLFHHLPGLITVERSDDQATPARPPLRQRFVVEVRDSVGRFVPAVFRLDVPHDGIYPTAALSSPVGGPPGFYLFAAPTRPTAGLAVIRAELVEQSGAPAAHAVLEVTGAGQTWYGLANAEGVAAVMFAYPAFGPTPPRSPPRSLAEARQPQRWPLIVRVRYQPSAQIAPPGSALPDLASLFAQNIAPVRAAIGGPAVASLAVELEFGRELALASAPGAQLIVG